MRIIYFILGAQDPRCYKRIQEFIDRNYEVKIFSFERKSIRPVNKLPTEYIGSFSNTTPYIQRIYMYFCSMWRLFRKYGGKNELWYYFGLPTCMFAFIFNRKGRYILEESDMSHLNLKSKMVRTILEYINIFLIKKSLVSVFTSEGFIDFHFPDKSKRPDNLVLMPNKLNPNITQLKAVEKKTTNLSRIRFGFVGFLRYQTVFNVSDVISKNFPYHEFHFYGIPDSKKNRELFDQLKSRNNVFFHGPFKNPEDLPEIYSNIDIVVSTYDTTSINVLYAEPNKLYESIYFRTPIIVSEKTFLATQVSKYKSGYIVNPFCEEQIVLLIKKIESSLPVISAAMINIPRETAIDSAEDLFLIMDKKLSSS